MAQINLLGQESGSGESVAVKLPMYFVRILVVVFILLLGYWAFLFVQSKITKNSISELQGEIITKQKQLMESGQRKELVKRQGQLAAANSLINEHEYWTRVLPEIARVTLRSARYMSFNIDGAGQAKMVVNVPSYTEMDKFLQAISMDEFNDVFQSVTVTSINKVQQGETQLVRFEISVKYNKDFLKKSEESNLSVLR